MAEAHVVNVGLVHVGPQGSVIQKSESIKAQLNFSTEHRVIPKSTVPNSADYPTVEAYIEAEAADDFILRHLGQYMIVTIKT